MKPDESVRDHKEGVKLGTECEYLTYLEHDLPDFGEVKTQPSYCGFNQDELAYCPMKEGSDEY